MRGRLALGIALLLFGRDPIDLHAERMPSEDRATVTVVLCDRAALPAAVQTEVRAQAERILASAGVELRWWNQDCQGPPQTRYFTLVVLPAFPKDWPFSPHAMGLAPITDGPYPRAYVFLDLVRSFNEGNRQASMTRSFGILLGHAIAHELGHLLGQPHAASGIMRARWGRQEWADAMAEILLFSRPAKRSGTGGG